MEQGGGNVDPSFHAAREGADRLVCPLEKPGLGKHLMDPLLQLLAFDPIGFPEKFKVLVSGQLFVQRNVLRNVADIFGDGIRFAGGIFAEQLRGAAVGLDDARQYFHRRRFA